MTTPTKAKKNPRNQPIKFDESLSAMVAPSYSVVPPRISTRQIALALWVVFGTATICVALGMTRLMLDARLAGTVLARPTPVATASIGVAPSSVPTITAAAPVVAYGTPQITTDSSVLQAQAGLPFGALGVVACQPSTNQDALQPGFTSVSSLQGNLGVPPAL